MVDNDHDILIEIKTKVGMIHDSYIKHCEEDATRYTTLDNSIKAAHRRLDGFLITGVLAIVIFVLGIILKMAGRI